METLGVPALLAQLHPAIDRAWEAEQRLHPHRAEPLHDEVQAFNLLRPSLHSLWERDLATSRELRRQLPVPGGAPELCHPNLLRAVGKRREENRYTDAVVALLGKAPRDETGVRLLGAFLRAIGEDRLTPLLLDTQLATASVSLRESLVGKDVGSAAMPDLRIELGDPGALGLLVVIENKIDDEDREDQLDTYERWSRTTVAGRPGWGPPVLVFLTPHGDPPVRASDPGSWKPMGYEQLVAAWRPLLASMPAGQPRTEVLRLFLASIIQEVLEVQFPVDDNDLLPCAARSYSRRVIERKDNIMSKPGPSLTFWMEQQPLLGQLPYVGNRLSDAVPTGVNEDDWRKLRRIQELAVEEAQQFLDACFAAIYLQHPALRADRGGTHASAGSWFHCQPCHIHEGRRGRKKQLYVSVSWWWHESDRQWLIVPSVQVWRKTERGPFLEDPVTVADRLRRAGVAKTPPKLLGEWMQNLSTNDRDVPLDAFPVSSDDDLDPTIAKVVDSIGLFVKNGAAAWRET